MAVTPTPTDDLSTFLGDQPGAERIYDNVMNVLPGIAVAAIKMALWNTMEEFALRSTCFRQELTWTMGVGVSSLTFNPIDADTLAFRILWQYGIVNARFDQPATLVDIDQPLASRSGRVLVATRPSSFSANMPDGFWSTRFEAMLDGTLYRLYGQPAKPWTSAQLAAYHGRRYRAALNAAHADANNRHGEERAWRYPMFAAGRRR